MRSCASAFRCSSLAAARRSASACRRASYCVQSLLLALAQLGQLRLEFPLAAVEIGRPGHQAGLEPSLRAGDGFGQLRAGLLGLPRDGVPALLRELTLLLPERVARLGAFAREDAVELGRALAGVLVEVHVDLRPRVLAYLLQVAYPAEAAR